MEKTSKAEIIKDAARDRFFTVETHWHRKLGEEHISSNISRMKLNIIMFGKDNEKGYCLSGNIKEDDISEIWSKVSSLPTLINMKNMMMMSATPSDTEDTSIADTTISMGSMKGKTIRSLLIDGKKADLLKQADWLQPNVAKYPANQKQIDAIHKSIDLYDAGKLDAAPTQTSALVMEILKTPLKSIGKPNENGHQKFYTISINYDGSRDKPFIITITNILGTTKKVGNLISLDKTISSKSESFYYDFKTGYSRFERMYLSYRTFIFGMDVRISKNVAAESAQYHQ